MSSLQEQLLKAGLADEKKAKRIAKEKRKQAKQQPKGAVVEDEIKVAAQKARQEAAEKAKQLNRERLQAQAEKELRAQVAQIVSQHKLDRSKADVSWQFVDGKKIKKLNVTAVQREQLARGHLSVVRNNDGYELVPNVVADKISARAPDAVAYRYDKTQADNQPAEDDPYADYPIPDDLDW